MFEEFNAKYEDFCWYEITNELSKNNIEKQAKQEKGNKAESDN